MKIYYDEGPDQVSMGIAGQFRRGEPKEVIDEISDALLKKESIKFKKADTKSAKKKEN